MKNKSYEKLKEKYIYYVRESHRDIDYANPKEVRAHNRAMDNTTKTAIEISNLYPDKIMDFAMLLDCDEQKIRIPTAVSLVRSMNAPDEIVKKAILTIENELPKMDRGDQLGFAVFLNNWYRNQ